MDVGSGFHFLNTGRYEFLAIYCHVPVGDATLQRPCQIRHFILYIFSHHMATMQWPWQSLHCLSALVIIFILYKYFW